MVLKLYGYDQSTCTKRVAAALHEKNVHFEFIGVNLQTGEHKSPAFLANQPFGQIPYIDDDGFILYESRAIVRYIDAKYPNQGTKLVPDDLKARALVEQGVSIEGANFDPHASKAVAEIIFKPFFGQTSDQAQFEEHIKQLGLRLDAYEVILSKQKYIGGDEFSIADLFHYPYGWMLAAAGSNILSDESRPHVVKWWKDITSRPSWVAVKDGVKSNL